MDGAVNIWSTVERLIDRAPLLSDLRAHRIHLLAAARWRSLGRPLPADLAQEERDSIMRTLTVPVLLAKVREAYDGPIVLMKGPEVAAFYPDPTLRPFRDLDLLVSDAAHMQRTLIRAGFEATGLEQLYVDIHHLRPLRWPGLPLLLEIHDRPKWVAWGEPPATSELLAAAVPGSTDGVLVLPRAPHALLVAAHSWAHEPLRRIGELIDVAAVSQGIAEAELLALARRFGLERIWRTTASAIESLLSDGHLQRSPRLWARNLPAARERSVLDSHLEHWLSPFSALPPSTALAATVRAVLRDLRPEAGESWRRKLRRSGYALGSPLTRRSEHIRALEQRRAASIPIHKRLAS